MTTISIKTESPIETANVEDQTGRKLFDNYGPVNVKETIGTFFLGVLAILLFLALQRSWNRYQVLIDQTQLLNHS
ncbi:MAG TPA: hypothetical protein VFY66_05750 [Anaerolineales bacterium]|nr:hypothetical protein [Anaerolineales bacterium]